MEPGHADVVSALAHRRPEINFIVDCIAAKVYREADPAVVVDTLAEPPNIFMKLVSFGQDSGEQYPFRDLWPFFARAVARFGPERMVFGTDFPHVLATCSYSQAINWLDELPFVDAAARAMIAEGTARELWKFQGD
jgi:L-fuconolactonase